MADKTVVRNPGEGDAYWMLGGLYELKAGAGETGGSASIFEMTLPAGAGPPPHTHSGGEAVYVLEGNLRYHIEDEVYEAARARSSTCRRERGRTSSPSRRSASS